MNMVKRMDDVERRLSALESRASFFPSKPTSRSFIPEERSRIVSDIKAQMADGCSFNKACCYAGVSTSFYYRWANSPDFKDLPRSGRPVKS